MSVQKKLSETLGKDIPVYLAMRYGKPSIPDVLNQMKADGIEQVFLMPQYPHYAMSSWETVVVKVYQDAEKLFPTLKIDLLQPFYQDADYIEALYEVSAPYFSKPHDLLLFSYHGIPERHLRKGDPSKAHCMEVKDCCSHCSPVQSTCYRAQVFATTKALVKRAGIATDKYSVSFQSRLAGEPWLTPFTDKVLEEFPKQGVKKILVMCPAFVSDCLETLEEISVEAKETFIEAGGEEFEQIPCLNDQKPYIDFLAGRVNTWASKH